MMTTKTRDHGPQSGVEEYFQALQGQQLEAATALRRLIRRIVPEAAEVVKWQRPVYELNGPLCYLQATKKHINLGFFKGDQLHDPEGLLEGSGKSMRHIKIHGPNDVTHASVADLLRQAVRLNTASR